jgi:hypothetical protein
MQSVLALAYPPPITLLIVAYNPLCHFFFLNWTPKMGRSTKAAPCPLEALEAREQDTKRTRKSTTRGSKRRWRRRPSRSCTCRTGPSWRARSEQKTR